MMSEEEEEEEEPKMVMTCVLCHAKFDADDGFIKKGEQVMCVACVCAFI